MAFTTANSGNRLERDEELSEMPKAKKKPKKKTLAQALKETQMGNCR